MGDADVEIRALDAALAGPLADFFAALRENGDEAFFHPHPLTAEEARARCSYSGADLYVAAVHDGRVVGYGMLRGWDEGYEVPSLGIALHPLARGSGLARRLMEQLHDLARARGARRVRLKVHHSNEPARRLYRTLGYRVTGRDGEQLVEHLELTG